MKILASTLVLGAMASACVTTPAPQSEPCLGNLVLEVRNETSSDVEVVEFRRGAGSRVVIAILGSGQHTVDIRNDPDYYYSTQFSRSRIAAVESAPRWGNGSVRMRRFCRDK